MTILQVLLRQRAAGRAHGLRRAGQQSRRCRGLLDALAVRLARLWTCPLPKEVHAAGYS